MKIVVIWMFLLVLQYGNLSACNFVGSFFIWDRLTTNIIRILKGDESIVNCLQPHPSQCLLATSGIEPIVRLWSPQPEVHDVEFSIIAFLLGIL